MGYKNTGRQEAKRVCFRRAGRLGVEPGEGVDPVPSGGRGDRVAGSTGVGATPGDGRVPGSLAPDPLLRDGERTETAGAGFGGAFPEPGSASARPAGGRWAPRALSARPVTRRFRPGPAGAVGRAIGARWPDGSRRGRPSRRSGHSAPSEDGRESASGETGCTSRPAWRKRRPPCRTAVRSWWASRVEAAAYLARPGQEDAPSGDGRRGSPPCVTGSPRPRSSAAGTIGFSTCWANGRRKPHRALRSLAYAGTREETERLQEVYLGVNFIDGLPYKEEKMGVAA